MLSETDHPLLDALRLLREIDGDYVDAHPETADDDLFDRMLKLWLCATAMYELELRGEAANRTSIEAEMATLGAEGFVFDRNLLFDLEQGFRDHGDFLNAGTVAMARA